MAFCGNSRQFGANLGGNRLTQAAKHSRRRPLADGLGRHGVRAAPDLSEESRHSVAQVKIAKNYYVFMVWRRGWDSNPLHVLNPRKLFILRSDKTDKSGTSAEVRYTADTRRAEVRRAEVCHGAR